MYTHFPRPVLPVIGIVVLMAVLVFPVTGSMSAPMNARDLTGTNMPGIDHWNIPVNSAQECADLCDTTPGCVGATYVLPNTIQGPDGHCWRKSVVTGNVENFNCISFLKQAVLPVTFCVMSNPHAGFDYKVLSNNFADPTALPGMAPLSVQFNDYSTGAQTWLWDFGDGTPASSEKNPNHIYTKGSTEGTVYKVTLTVTGSCPGETDTIAIPQNVYVYDNVGKVQLSSTPGGARFYIDGVDSFEITNPDGVSYHVLQLTPGTHAILLTLDGYENSSTDLTIINGRIITFSPVLEKISTPSSPPSAGTLQITTTPEGAEVYVDGGSQGLTSPATLSTLAPGSHTVRLTKAGYIDYQGTVMVQSGQTVPLNIVLVPATSPSAGTTTTGVPAGTGSPQVTASLAGDGVSPGGPQASGTTGTLTVRSNPANASVYLDGELMGTTPVTAPSVSAGTHRLLLTLNNYADISRVVEISAGSDKEMDLDFNKKSPGFALPATLAAVALAALVLLLKRED
jgi:PKD repeat protein